MRNLPQLIGKTPIFRNSSLISRSPGQHTCQLLLSLVETLPPPVVLSLIGQSLLLLVPQRTPPTIQIRICRPCKLHPHLQSNLNMPLQKPLVLPHQTALVVLHVRQNPRKGNSKGMLKQENAHRLAAKLWSHTAKLSLHTPVLSLHSSSPHYVASYAPPNEPRSLQEAMASPFAKEWTAAILQELGSLDKHGTY